LNNLELPVRSSQIVNRIVINLIPRCFVLALFLRLSLSGTATAEPLRVISGPLASGQAFVFCTFDGIRENCFLDTGSAMTLLVNSEKLSGKTNAGTFHFKGATGIPQQGETIQIHSALLDGVEFYNLKIGRVQRDAQVQSALGIDLLSRRPFSLNFRFKPSLHLDPKTPRKLFTTLEVGSHHLFTIPITIGKMEARAMWDSGAGITVVDESFIQSHPTNFKSTDEFESATDGTGASIPVKTYRARIIKIGHRTFRNSRVIATDLSVLRANGNPPVQVVIGFNFIRKCDWYFDAKQRKWSVR
jgi:hypothetical protein